MTNANQILINFTSILGDFAGAVTAIALLVFVWGVVQFIFEIGNAKGDPEKAREDGKRRMIYGIVGLFVIVSIWGIVSLLINMFGIPNTPTQDAPLIDL